MNVEQIVSWLALIGERHVEVAREWVNTHCPLAPWRHSGGRDSRPSFGVRIEPGESLCKCWSCGFLGRQTELLIHLDQELGSEADTFEVAEAMRRVALAADGSEAVELGEWLESQAPEPDSVFPEEWLATFPSGIDHPYLEARGVPRRVAEFLDVRFSFREQRVCFPVRNWDGDLVGLHGRAVTDETVPAYKMMLCGGRKNPLAWLGESWVDPSRPCVIVESVFDLARVLQCYGNVIAPLTASIGQRKVERVARLDHVVTFLDPDDAGDRARRMIDATLRGSAVVEHVGGYYQQDPGAQTPREVSDRLADHVDVHDVVV